MNRGWLAAAGRTWVMWFMVTTAEPGCLARGA
jgi:hypothetical protein